MEHEFVVVDPAVRCTKCGRGTTAVFTGGICSRCANVWSPAQRAGMAETQRNPYKRIAKKFNGRAPEKKEQDDERM